MKLRVKVDDEVTDFELSEIGEQVLRNALPAIRQQNNYPPDSTDEQVIANLMENQLKALVRSMIPL